MSLYIVFLEEDFGFDGKELVANGVVVDMHAAKLGKAGKSSIVTMLHEHELRRLREEQHAHAEDESRHDLQRELYSPRGIGLSSAAVGADVLSWVEGRGGRGSASVWDIGSTAYAADVQTVLPESTDLNNPLSGESSPRTRSSKIVVIVAR